MRPPDGQFDAIEGVQPSSPALSVRLVAGILGMIVVLMVVGLILRRTDDGNEANDFTVTLIGTDDSARFTVDATRGLVEVSDARVGPAHYFVIDEQVIVDAASLSIDTPDEWVSVPASAVFDDPSILDAERVVQAFSLEAKQCVLPDKNADRLVKLAVDQTFASGADTTLYDLCGAGVTGGAWDDGRSVSARKAPVSTFEAPTKVVAAADLGDQAQAILDEVTAMFDADSPRP